MTEMYDRDGPEFREAKTLEEKANALTIVRVVANFIELEAIEAPSKSIRSRSREQAAKYNRWLDSRIEEVEHTYPSEDQSLRAVIEARAAKITQERLEALAHNKARIARQSK